jgi:hypothetical protein
LPDDPTPQPPTTKPFPDPIPGIIPFGTLTIFAGAPGVGKTTMLIEWMRRWRDGRTICGHQAHDPTWFYYICADRGLSAQAFYDLVGFTDRLTFFSVVSADSKLNVDDLQKSEHGKTLLAHCLTELAPIPGSHLIIDPLSPLFISGSPNNQRDVAASLIRLSRRIEDLQFNVTGTAHFGKQKADRQDRYRRPQDRISGSGAFSGYSDTQMYLVDPEKDQPYYLLGWNPRYHPPEEFKFTRERWFVPYTGLCDVGVDADTDRPTQVLVLIPDTGIFYNDLVDAVCQRFDVSPSTAKRDIKELSTRGLIEREQQTGKIQRRKVN